MYLPKKLLPVGLMASAMACSTSTGSPERTDSGARSSQDVGMPVSADAGRMDLGDVDAGSTDAVDAGHRDGGEQDAALREGELRLDQPLRHDGIDRSYHLYLPSTPAGAPVVFLMHGFGVSNDSLLGLEPSTPSGGYEVWLEIAARDNVIIVAPRGISGPDGTIGWNDCRTEAQSQNPSTDDVGFIRAMVDELVRSFQANRKRVYIVGTSNGGHISIRMALESPSTIAAFAANSASLAGNSACAEARGQVSALFVNGTEDRLMP
ncbi:MAG: alpha/beta hydrolase-fold protein [Myxococcota bacterium]